MTIDLALCLARSPRARLLALSGDDGSAWLRGRLPYLAHAIFLTHWGMQCNDERLRHKRSHCVDAQLGFRAHHSGQDIVMPPLHSPHRLLPASTWLRGLPHTGTSPALSPPSKPPPSKATLPSYAVVEPAAPQHLEALSANRSWSYLLYFVGKVRRSFCSLL